MEWVDGTGVERLVLIDAGPDFREQALRHGLRRCDGVFVTHTHTDHIFGIDELRRFTAIMEGRPGVPIYAEERAWVELRRIYKHVFEQHLNVNDSWVATLMPGVLEAPDAGRGEAQGGAGVAVELFGMRFTPVRVLHGKLPILAFRIEPVEGGGETGGGEGGLWPMAWVTDISSMPPASWGAFEGVRTLFLDGLRHRKHATHYSIGQAEGVSARIGAERTFLIHLNHEVVHGRDEGGLREGVRFAVDGLVLAAGEGGGVSGWVERGRGVREGYGWEGGGVREGGGGVIAGGQVDR